MLVLINQSGGEVEVDTTQLDEDAPVILYNDRVGANGNYQMVDFDPVNDMANARFTIYYADGTEEEFNWGEQSEDAKVDIAQLDEPS